MGQSGWRAPQKPEEWLVYLVGGAAAVYIVCCLPSLFGPSSLLGVISILLTGAFLGVVTLLGILVYLFFSLTATDPATQGTKKPCSHSQVPTLEARGDEPQTKQQNHDSVVQEMLQGAEPRAPPHSFMEGGAYSGWVWTIPSSKYDVNEALINWPPATEGPKAVATKWWGSLRGTTLYLARSSGLEQSYLVPVVEVDLTGCLVEVVKGGLKTKSKWWRKCPIQISHLDRQLLHSETSVAFFAEGSAAKEQWYTALRASAGSAPSVQTVEALYAAFCYQARDDVEYPQVIDCLEGEGDAGSLATPKCNAVRAGQNQGGKTWGRWFSKRKSSSPQKSRAGSQSATRGSSPKRGALPPGFINPLELDQAWMGKGAVPGQLAAPIAKNGQEHLAVATQQLQDGGADPGGLNEGGSGRGSVSGGSPKKAMQSLQSEIPPASSQSQAEQLKLASKSVQFPVQKTVGESPASDASDGEPQLSRSSPASVSERVTEGRPETKLQQYPSIPLEQGVNMLLARAGFDLLRSPAVKEALKSRIHRKLNELRIPDYIHGFEVVDIDVGSGVPAIHNLRALPTPNSTIWPQILFDLNFEGDINITIETKLDVRDHIAWSQFDKAINRLEGGGGGGDASWGEPPDVSPVDSEDDMPGTEASSSADPTEEVSKVNAQKKGFMANMLPLRQRFAKGIRQLAEVTADHLSRMQLKLRLEIRALKGPMYVWLPPPPGDRLWFSFVTPPQLIAQATPLVGGRLLKYSYQATRVSQWIAGKLQSSITKNMVFPSCSDIPLPFLLAVDHPDVGSAPAAFPTLGGDQVPQKTTNASLKKQPQAGEEAKVNKAASKLLRAVVDTPAPTSSLELVDDSQKPTTHTRGKQLSPSASWKITKGSRGGSEKPAGSPTKMFWGRKNASSPQASQRSLDAKGVSSQQGHSTEHQGLSATKDRDTSSADTSAYASAAPAAAIQDSSADERTADHGGGHVSTPVMGPFAAVSESAEVGSQGQPVINLPGSVGTDVSQDQAKDAEEDPVVQGFGSNVGRATTPGSTGALRQSRELEQHVPSSSSRETPTALVPVDTPSDHDTAHVVAAVDPSQGTAQAVASESLAMQGRAAEAPAGDVDWRPADVYLNDVQEAGSPGERQGGARTASLHSERSDGGAISSSDSLAAVRPDDLLTSASPNRGSDRRQGSAIEDWDAGSLGRESSGLDLERGGSSSSQKRQTSASSVVQKHWEAFKSRNPNQAGNLQQQGRKFAGAMEKLREQAQEQFRRTQEQMRKQQELRKSQKSMNTNKLSGKDT